MRTVKYMLVALITLIFLTMAVTWAKSSGVIPSAFEPAINMLITVAVLSLVVGAAIKSFQAEESIAVWIIGVFLGSVICLMILSKFVYGQEVLRLLKGIFTGDTFNFIVNEIKKIF